MFCSHIFVAERHSDSCNIIWMSSSVSQKIRHSNDIATVVVYFCNKYMWTQHVFYNTTGKSSNLKTCKSINLQNIIFIRKVFKKRWNLRPDNQKLSPPPPSSTALRSKHGIYAPLCPCYPRSHDWCIMEIAIGPGFKVSSKTLKYQRIKPVSLIKWVLTSLCHGCSTCGCIHMQGYCKNPKISDTWKFAVITLKAEQDGFSLQ